MMVDLKCAGCLLGQALGAVKLVTSEKKMVENIRRKVSKYLHSLSPELSLREVKKEIYNIVTAETGVEDVCQNVRRKINGSALSLYRVFKEEIKKSDDGLLTAVKLAMAAGIIDYSEAVCLSAGQLKDKISREELAKINTKDEKLFDYAGFKHSLAKAKTVFYLADKIGEIVFDKIFIEQLRDTFSNIKEVIFAVKDKPMFLCALIEDANFCEIDSCAQVISSEVFDSGMVLDLASQDFLEAYQRSEVVISKGYGNYEALFQEDKLICALFTVGCRVLGKHIGCNLGSTVLKVKVA